MSHLVLFLVLQTLALDVFPAVSAAPAVVRVRATVERNAANRTVCLSYDGPEFKRSCYPAGQRVETMWWAVRWPGEYEAMLDVLSIVDGREQHHRRVVPFRVLGAAL